MKKHYDFYWKKLDNVGVYYASTTTNSNPNIYRLSVRFKEKIKKDALDSAIDDTLLTIPTFNVKLRKGLFWYYLEHNSEQPIIMEDSNFPFSSINNFSNNYFLFKVTYFEKRINVDFSHILTDGTGALHFLETLVTNYLKIRHPKKIKQDIVVESELLSQNEMGVDSFLKYSKINSDDKKMLRERSEKSYDIKGQKNNRGSTSVIIGTVSVEQLKAITKPKQATITSFLTAALIYAIYEYDYKYTGSKDQIVICIPVNLRNYFPSYSMSNFFSTIMINVDVSKGANSFDEILKIVTSKMVEELNKDVLLKKFRTFVTLQKNIILRFIPLVIKDVLLRGISSMVSERGSTSTLSNLGIVRVGKELGEYIDKFDMIAYNDAQLPIKLGLCSFGDKLSISFSSIISSTEIERGFFTYLSSLGLDVTIASSINESDVEGTQNEIL